MGATNHNIITDARGWMKDQQRRLNHQEARPQIRSASDLLGPGIAATAIQLTDWSSDETAFNGFFWSGPGALNGPNSAHYYIGSVLATADGYGIMTVREFRGATVQPLPQWVREFAGSLGGGRTFGPWASF